MDSIKDNIELRSDKVRSIIGQIPPWLIRKGIFVILLVIVVLLVGSYYFKYPYTITSTVQYSQIDNSFVGVIKIPANEILKIKKGQKVEIYFNDIKDLNGLIFESKIIEISNKVTITDKKGFYKAKIDKVENLIITEKANGIVKITTDETSFFERIIKPFKILRKKSDI